MTNTTYYSLKKPEDNDNVLISDLNGNADAIDQALHGLDEGLKGLKYEPPLTQAGSKSAVADGDGLVVTDSADGNKTKRVLWSAVKSALSALFAAKTHQHAAADITSGALSISRGGTGQSTALDAAKTLGRGYGTCSTPGATVAKTVALSSFSLNTGAVVGVRFSYANTAANPTLNVNSTGAKSIYNFQTNTNIKPGDIAAGMTAFFTYNGAQWVLLNPCSDPSVVSGSGVTPSDYGRDSAVEIDLGFRPSLIAVKGYAYNAWGFSTDTLRIELGGGSSSYISSFSITDNGFTVYAEDSNGTGKGYDYLAFR
ncbi:hypothetical protein [uncultured Pseudoflavonifractor sp.]|uniref:hypothetical protein n=1 Tax=uncultured Pseudoflavonifractor sp. TaxID=1221379 RepID=UPI0025DC9F34|nr:hypothetical protein [uncultured Pseudoflavonifractor sp.]